MSLFKYSIKILKADCFVIFYEKIHLSSLIFLCFIGICPFLCQRWDIIHTTKSVPILYRVLMNKKRTFIRNTFGKAFHNKIVTIQLFLHYETKDTLGFPSISLIVSYMLSSSDRVAFGPPIPVLTLPGCYSITRMPLFFSSSLRLLVIMFNVAWKYVYTMEFFNVRHVPYCV